MDPSAISGLGVLLHWAVLTAADSQTGSVGKSNRSKNKCSCAGGVERGGSGSERLFVGGIGRCREAARPRTAGWRDGEKAVFVEESAGGAGRMETEGRSRRRKEKEEGSAEALEAE